MPQIQTLEQIMGIGKESVFLTPVIPTFATPVTGGGVTPQYGAIFDEARRGIGAAVFDIIDGPAQGEASFEGPVYPDSIGDFLLAIFGTDTPVGAMDPYTHTFSVATLPPSYTVVEEVSRTGAGMLEMAGARCSELVFSYDTSEGLLAFTSSFMGDAPTKETIVMPAATTADSPWAGWKGTVASTGISARVLAAEITLSREVEVVHTGEAVRGINSANVGPLDISGTLDLQADDLSDFDLSVAGTRQLLTVTLDDVANSRSIVFRMTDTYFNAAPIELDRGNLGLRNRLSFRSIHNTTDSGPGEVDLENGIAAY